MINKLYGIERGLKDGSAETSKLGREEPRLPVLAQLKNWIEKTQPQITTQNALDKAVGHLANNWCKLERYFLHGYLAIDNNAAEPTIRSLVIDRKNWLLATRPKARQPVRNFAVWSRQPKPTAKNLMRGCATHRNVCRRRPQWMHNNPIEG